MREVETNKFMQSLKEVLRKESDTADFAHRYNNEWRARTELMLGGNSVKRTAGIIYKTLSEFYGRELSLRFDMNSNIKQEVAFERYADCIVYKELGSNWNDWYKGELYHDLIIEVENKIEEFSGTFSDLLRIQGKRKVGVFYFDNTINAEMFLEGRKKNIKHVLKYFTEKGFLEAEGTEYLFIFLPDRYKEDFINSIIGFGFHIVINEEKRIDVNKTLVSVF